MAKFKAWTYTTPGYPQCLSQTTLSLPEILSTTELLVQVEAAAVNPVDIQLMNVPLWSLPYLNYVKGVGCDFAGTVLKAGEESSFSVGDEVFGLIMAPGIGTVGEIAIVDTKSCVVLKKPQDWSWVQAAALPLVWLTAWTCIASVESYIGETKTVAILGGSSATGMYTVFLAKERGWKVISTCSGRNIDFVKSMGASEVVDYTQESVPDRIRAAKPDAIIDCVGGTECLGIAKRYVTIVGDKTSRNTMGGSALYLTSPRMVLRWLYGKTGYGEVYDCIMLEGKKEYLEEATKLPQDMIVIDTSSAAFLTALLSASNPSGIHKCGL
ncbi:NAD(P)-binding protein [Tothia fuscella]|uniref:NAD(P)-binding protein n=1 Tax=Tothia fuscella TaxID=1048955 RepID=A0A9P4TZD3_9PEZI|nr:NAD(P)-binding protein [Tothia fuscella]